MDQENREHFFRFEENVKYTKKDKFWNYRFTLACSLVYTLVTRFPENDLLLINSFRHIVFKHKANIGVYINTLDIFIGIFIQAYNFMYVL